ncbi:MAG: signal peptidase [Ilumatobacter sp.]|jgi:signal peptidase
MTDDTAILLGKGGVEHDSNVVEEEPLWHRVLSIAFTVAVVVFTIYFWPAVLGGGSRIITVSGHSMEPTYVSNDIVVTRDSGGISLGDVVVFEVPEGPAEGMLVIHRVHEVNDEGLFITQGDNRDTPDQWQLTESDIVGKPLAHIPRGGIFLDLLRNIRVIGGLVGLVVLFLLWPDDEEIDAAKDFARNDETNAFERDAAWSLVDPWVVMKPVMNAMASLDELAVSWLDHELEQSIDDDVMADAIAWLNEQLEGCNQPAAH